MQKRKKGRTLSRKTGVRKALLVSVARALAQKERITLTEAKAKEVSPFVEKLVSTAKKNSLASRRELRKYFQPSLVKKMMEEVAPRYSSRNGGYTRIIKLAPRKSDSARMAIIEWVK